MPKSYKYLADSQHGSACGNPEDEQETCNQEEWGEAADHMVCICKSKLMATANVYLLLYLPFCVEKWLSTNDMRWRMCFLLSHNLAICYQTDFEMLAST